MGVGTKPSKHKYDQNNHLRCSSSRYLVHGGFCCSSYSYRSPRCLASSPCCLAFALCWMACRSCLNFHDESILKCCIRSPLLDILNKKYTLLPKKKKKKKKKHFSPKKKKKKKKKS